MKLTQGECILTTLKNMHDAERFRQNIELECIRKQKKNQNF